MTSAQQLALSWARDDGELIVGGLDGRPVRMQTVNRCVGKGWLTRSSSSFDRPRNSVFYDGWKITDLGRTALAAVEQER